MSGFFSSVQCARAEEIPDEGEIILSGCRPRSGGARSGGEPVTVRSVQGRMTQNTHPLMSTYRGMLRRCDSPKSVNFRYYGGRGITVCSHWRGRNGFWNFVADMGPRPPGCSLERIDVNGNYEPTNCRWATASEQNRNKRNTVRAVFDGSLVAVADRVQVAAVSLSGVKNRIRLGMDPGLAIMLPRRDGYRFRPRPVPTAEFTALVIAALSQGRSHRGIALDLGVTHSDVRLAIKHARAAGDLPPAGPNRARLGPGPRPRRSG